ncbi:hypothetical protein [Flavobacterium sp. 5]|uniref:hypothetical protein n=1 Tax=Flavobacterium sp. 5 TaxID=2035199 RepID=UPI000CA67591|nr:hypothetical protein [Flavobacterium sp. 5]PKB18217.1 hypothetical protein CLU82_3480 [Flavobacterium sp. 5]
MKLPPKIALFLCLSVMLFNSCSSDDSKTETTKTDSATLITFTDVTFSLDQVEGFDAGRYFSTELGKSYKKSQIDATILPKIDIAFYSGGQSLDYFMSPNDSDYGIKNASLSLFINYQKDLLTIDQFNKIEKASDFDTLKIDTDDDESFPDSYTPNIVLFKNASGKKGAIYIKSVHRVGYDPRIVVDIKIQK